MVVKGVICHFDGDATSQAKMLRSPLKLQMRLSNMLTAQ
jgi:hypothetical protein